MKTVEINNADDSNKSFFGFDEFIHHHKSKGFILIEEVCHKVNRKIEEVKKLLPEIPHVKTSYNDKEYIFIHKDYVGKMLKFVFIWEKPTFFEKKIMIYFWNTIKHGFLKELPEKYHEMARLLFEKNKSFDEISQILNFEKTQLYYSFKIIQSMIIKWIKKISELDEMNDKLEKENEMLREQLIGHGINFKKDLSMKLANTRLSLNTINFLNERDIYTIGDLKGFLKNKALFSLTKKDDRFRRKIYDELRYFCKKNNLK